MELNKDLFKLIILISKKSEIESLCLVSKSFYEYCYDKIIWEKLFTNDNLTILNNNINSIAEYIQEYKKVSYATYITNCLFDMIKYNGKLKINKIDTCCILLNNKINLSKILPERFIKDKPLKYDKVELFIDLWNGGVIGCEYSLNDNIIYYNDIILDYELKEFIVNLLYWIPNINMIDLNNKPFMYIKNEKRFLCFTTIERNRFDYWNDCMKIYHQKK